MDVLTSATSAHRDREEGELTSPPAISAEVDGNRLELIELGSQRLKAIVELIDSAQHSVRLLFYMFNSDASGHAVREALLNAARRGAKVTILLDGFGCGDADSAFFDSLKDLNGKVCEFHPNYGRRYLLRNHQKLAIADDERAIIGGSNIHDSYLQDDGPNHWRDLWLSLEGPAVARASSYFDALFQWTTTKHAKLRNLRKLVFRFSDREGALQWKFSGPVARRNPWPTAIARDIIAGTRFDLISAYFSPPRPMLRRIRRLGSKARIITASKSDNNATIAAARHTYSRLLRRGVQMYEYQPARLHTKLAIVDDVVHIGSSNFDFRSLYINLELMLRIEDQGFADQMRGYFEREMKDSLAITSKLHKERANFWRRFKWAASFFLVNTMDYTVTRRLNFTTEA